MREAAADVYPPPVPARTIAIVGAGPAGLMAAEVLATLGHGVTVFERMPSPARKLLLAGRGGLNLTHSEPLPILLQRYGDNAGFVRGAVEVFPPRALVAWANGLGQETFTGSSGRVFPKAMKASPLLRAWLKRLDGLGVKIVTRHTFKGFAGNGALRFAGPDGAPVDVHSDATLLALGGASWPKLGSDGAWAEALREAGVALAPFEPANAGILIPWSDVFLRKFEGMPLKRISITVEGHTVRGEALITRTGLEGGVVYAASHHLRAALRSGPARVTFDLKPDASAAALAERLRRGDPKDSLANRLRKTVGLARPAIALLREAGPLPHGVEALAERLKTLNLTATGIAGLSRAISSAGGVHLGGIDDKAMLTALPGVFVAGEMLDWEAPTGGYLLQACFATGHWAAHGVAAWLAATASPRGTAVKEQRVP